MEAYKRIGRAKNIVRLRLRSHNCCGAKLMLLSSSLYLAGLVESREAERGTYQGGLCDHKAALPTHWGMSSIRLRKVSSFARSSGIARATISTR
jgi:hypothetical protein